MVMFSGFFNLFLVRLNILSLEFSHLLNLIEINDKAVRISMILTNTFSAENSLMI